MSVELGGKHSEEESGDDIMMEDADGTGSLKEDYSFGLHPKLSAPTTFFEGSLVAFPRRRRRQRSLARTDTSRSWLSRLLGLSDFLAPAVWRAASIEGVGTAGLVFTSILGTIACIEGGFEPVSKAVGLIHVAITSLFIIATAPASGGHVNPLITLATVTCGLTSFTRGILYVSFQSAGGIIGAACAWGVLPRSTSEKYHLAGCLLRQQVVNADGTLVTSGVGPGEGFVSETAFSFVLIFLAFGIALEPKQGQVMGPALAPLFVGLTLGLLIFISGDLVPPGYTGAGMNPARCFGPAVVQGGELWTFNWVFWVGPIFASLLQGIVFNLVPPHHVEGFKQGRGTFPFFRVRLADIVEEGSSSDGSN